MKTQSNKIHPDTHDIMLEALIVQFHIKPGFVEQFESAIKQNAVTSLNEEPGCKFFDVCRDPADPTVFFLYELYDNQEAIQAHMRSRHFLEFSEQTKDWVAQKTVHAMQRSVGGMLP